MRPLHALLVVLTLAAGLVAALFLIQTDEHGGIAAEPSASTSTTAPSGATHAPATLDAPEGQERGVVRVSEKPEAGAARAGEEKPGAPASAGLLGRLLDAR